MVSRTPYPSHRRRSHRSPEDDHRTGSAGKGGGMTDARGTRPLRIANFSGFFGDRASALTEMLRGGPVDVLTGDYLAEVTMLVLAKTRLKDPEGGYAASFLQHLAPVLSEIQRAGG